MLDSSNENVPTSVVSTNNETTTTPASNTPDKNNNGNATSGQVTKETIEKLIKGIRNA